MGGDDVVAPALLVEAEERARALGVVVGDAKRDRGTHAREAVGVIGRFVPRITVTRRPHSV